MGWKDLITAAEQLTLPWTGERSLRSATRIWGIRGRLPPEFGWNRFEGDNGRVARWIEPADPAPELLTHHVAGYLCGDRLVGDDARVDLDVAKICAATETVFLLPEGLERFSRISAGRVYPGGPLIFRQEEMPLGMEGDVRNAYLDRATSVDTVPGVPSGLDAAFRVESWQRLQVEHQRAELLRKQREEEERLLREQRRREIAEQIGTAVGRREMARMDFQEAAKAALATTDAEYLDHRPGGNRNEMIVQFRTNRRRFECVVDKTTLRVIDGGLCLNAHYDDPDFEEGTRGDTWLTLESLPAIYAQAMREGKLVVFRHVD